MFASFFTIEAILIQYVNDWQGILQLNLLGARLKKFQQPHFFSKKRKWKLMMDIPLDGPFVHCFQIKLEFWLFGLKEKPPELGQEPKTNSTYMRHQEWEVNSNHVGVRQALSLPVNSYSIGVSTTVEFNP